jgi:hypothetical protein
MSLPFEIFTDVNSTGSLRYRNIISYLALGTPNASSPEFYNVIGRHFCRTGILTRERRNLTSIE